MLGPKRHIKKNQWLTRWVQILLGPEYNYLGVSKRTTHYRCTVASGWAPIRIQDFVDSCAGRIKIDRVLRRSRDFTERSRRCWGAMCDICRNARQNESVKLILMRVVSVNLTTALGEIQFSEEDLDPSRSDRTICDVRSEGSPGGNTR